MFGINNNRKEQELVRTMILEEKIRLYPFKDVYRVYGDTFENRAALKKVGIAFKEQYDGVVITKADLDAADLLATDPIVGGISYKQNHIILNENNGLGIIDIKDWEFITEIK